MFSGPVVELAGTIGRRMLVALMPDRRSTTAKATISINILTPDP